MNDRFKFRVYYKPHNKVYNVICLNCDSQNEIIIEYKGSTAVVEWKNCEIIQSTGLKDKNGKLIYELDYIKYKKETYKLNIDKFLGITLTNILSGDIIVMDDLILFNCEVISNEFERDTKV